MARNLFGGTTSDVAEDIDGHRIPGAVGTVWNGPSDGAVQLTDLTDADGAPIIQLVADSRGFVPSFYGPPDDSERVWIDFGVGRLALVSVTVGDRLKAHIGALDPHQSRVYTDQRIETVVSKAGAEVNSPSDANWLTVTVPLAVDDAGSVIALKSGSSTYTRISNSGAVYVDTLDKRVALAVGAPGYTAADAVINVSNSKATSSTAQSIFRVMGDGSVVAAGAVSASNLGAARVYSGPTAPASPKAGDVWVQYG
ncbi:hypothetical protein [Streptomyces decoyicus]